MLTRVVASRQLLRVKPHLVVLGSALAASASLLLLAAASSRALMATAVVPTGVSFASIYPTVLGLAGTRFQIARAPHSAFCFRSLWRAA